MLLKKLWPILFVRSCYADVLNSGTHADNYIVPAIVAALGSNPLQVDYDSVFSIINVVPNSGNTSYAFTSVLTGISPVNHAPYSVLNASTCQYSPQYDQQFYSALATQGAVYSIAMAAQICGAGVTGNYPGTLTSSTSSPNSVNGGSTWGIEFGLTASYKGLDTSADSWVSAEMTGFFAAIKYQHPTWSWFDVKAAFRQTAANWATGYSATTYGYGFLNYDAATAIASTSSLYLQPPGINTAVGGGLLVTLYPFRQARRAHEVLYSVSSSYVWPVKNEYTTADITASGATLLYTSNGTDVTPVYSYVPVANGTITLVAFTTDGAGNYSRVESFSKVTKTVTVNFMCTP